LAKLHIPGEQQKKLSEVEAADIAAALIDLYYYYNHITGD
jgi:hypothetical protein